MRRLQTLWELGAIPPRWKTRLKRFAGKSDGITSREHKGKKIVHPRNRAELEREGQAMVVGLNRDENKGKEQIIMKQKRVQLVFILACCLQFVLVCQLYAGYKMKFSSPEIIKGCSFLYDPTGQYADDRSNARWDMDGDNIPEIVIYDVVQDTGYDPGFRVTCYDSRSGIQKWQRKDTSTMWDKEFAPPALLGFFDVDVDGEREAVFFNSGAVYVINWKTNVIELKLTTYLWPVVFDMDGDGYVDIGIRVNNLTTGSWHYEVWGSDKPIGTVQPVLSKQNTAKPFFNVFQAQMYSGTKIEYQVQKKGMVALRIFNADGALVKDLVGGVRDCGDYDVLWNGTGNSGERVAAGNYFYQLSVDAFRSTKKAIILR
jgi:hypothetical protein